MSSKLSTPEAGTTAAEKPKPEEKTASPNTTNNVSVVSGSTRAEVHNLFAYRPLELFSGNTTITQGMTNATLLLTGAFLPHVGAPAVVAATVAGVKPRRLVRSTWDLLTAPVRLSYNVATNVLKWPINVGARLFGYGKAVAEDVATDTPGESHNALEQLWGAVKTGLGAIFYKLPKKIINTATEYPKLAIAIIALIATGKFDEALSILWKLFLAAAQKMGVDVGSPVPTPAPPTPSPLPNPTPATPSDGGGIGPWLKKHAVKWLFE